MTQAQVFIDDDSQLRRWRWPIRIAATAGVVLLIYWGYCWGWWLRDNRFAQLVFQCNCPAVSEQVRYAPFQVIASACTQPAAIVSPGGKYSVISQQVPAPTYLVRTTSDAVQEHAFSLDKQVTNWFFLDDRFIFYQSPASFFLLDVPHRTTIPVPTIAHYRDWTPVRGADMYIVGTSQMVIVATHADGSVTPVRIVDTSGVDNRALAEDQRSFGLTLHVLPEIEIPAAHNHPWYADSSGVMCQSSRQRLLETPWRPGESTRAPFWPAGWMADDRGVIYRTTSDSYLIAGQDIMPSLTSFSLVKVPQPVLYLPVDNALGADPRCTP